MKKCKENGPSSDVRVVKFVSMHSDSLDSHQVHLIASDKCVCVQKRVIMSDSVQRDLNWQGIMCSIDEGRESQREYVSQHVIDRYRKSIWISDPSIKGTKLLFQVIKAKKINVQRERPPL